MLTPLRAAMTTFDAGLTVFVLEAMRRPERGVHEGMALPLRAVLAQVFPQVKARIDRLEQQILDMYRVSGMPCVCCHTRPFKGQSKSLALLTSDGTALVDLQVVCWSIPNCGAEDCLRKAEELRLIFHHDFAAQSKRKDVTTVQGRTLGMELCNYEACRRVRTPDMAPFRQCPHCQEMAYCTRDCQEADWDLLHRRSCRRQPANLAATVGDGLRVDWTMHLVGCATQHVKSLTRVDLVYHPRLPIPSIDALWAAEKAGAEVTPFVMVWLHFHLNTQQHDVAKKAMAGKLKALSAPHCLACQHRLTEPRTCVVLRVPMPQGDRLSVESFMALVCADDPKCTVVGDAALAEAARIDLATPRQTLRACDQCNTYPLNTPFQRCSRCKVVAYCGAECQREHWPTHKPYCAPPAPDGSET